LTLFGYDLRFHAEQFAVGEVIGGKPAELIRTALARAYSCEELARPPGRSRNSSESFLHGLAIDRGCAAGPSNAASPGPSYRYPPKFALH